MSEIHDLPEWAKILVLGPHKLRNIDSNFSKKKLAIGRILDDFVLQ